ncbi:unnamed protein product [Fusarium graminearum]|nr:unnamed protein product [Fusarium graminearum]
MAETTLHFRGYIAKDWQHPTKANTGSEEHIIASVALTSAELSSANHADVSPLSSLLNRSHQYPPILIFDYDGVAVVRPNGQGRIVAPRFTRIEDLSIHSISEVFDQGASSPAIFTFQRNTDFDGLDVFVSIGDDGIHGLKRWIKKLQSNGLLCADMGKSGYDCMDAHIQVGSPRLRAPRGLDGFFLLQKSQLDPDNIGTMLSEFEPNIDRVCSFLFAEVEFCAVAANDLGNHSVVVWSGNRVTINCAVGGENDVEAGNGDIFPGFDFNTFFHEAQLQDSHAQEDDVLYVRYFQVAGNTGRVMEVKGEEGWVELMAFMKNVLRHSQVDSRHTLIILRRDDATWPARSGLIVRKFVEEEGIE